jgi:hypothetical protein
MGLDSDSVLICGMHRGGTTVMGESLKASSKFTYLYEPFHRQRGIRGVDHWFPYAVRGNTPHYCSLVDSFFSRKFAYKRSYITGRSKWRDALRLLVGSRHAWRALPYRLGSRKPILIKCALSSFLSGYMKSAHGTKVIIMVRHPAAVHRSISRQGWRFNLARLFDQPALAQELGSLEIDFETGGTDPAVENGHLWACVYRMLLNIHGPVNANPDVLWVRHEDYCADSFATMRAVAAFAGTEFNESMQRYLYTHTQSSNVEPVNGKAWDRVRDSAGTAWAWKKELPEKTISRLKSLTQPTVDLFYGADTWN